MVLVYEFMYGGDLERRLHKRAPETPALNLQQRMRIALDIAEGLKFLHHECDPPVVHRDIKPANVLLDDQGSARISGFGRARTIVPGRSLAIPAGTLAYMDPELVKPGSSAMHPGHDVYSFGVVLLELLSNRQAVPVRGSADGGEHICTWAEEKLGDTSEVAELVQPWMTSLNSRERELVSKLGRLALEVTSTPCEERKSMIEVCNLLATRQRMPTSSGGTYSSKGSTARRAPSLGCGPGPERCRMSQEPWGRPFTIKTSTARLNSTTRRP